MIGSLDTEIEPKRELCIAFGVFFVGSLPDSHSLGLGLCMVVQGV